MEYKIQIIAGKYIINNVLFKGRVQQNLLLQGFLKYILFTFYLEVMVLKRF